LHWWKDTMCTSRRCSCHCFTGGQFLLKSKPYILHKASGGSPTEHLYNAWFHQCSLCHLSCQPLSWPQTPDHGPCISLLHNRLSVTPLCVTEDQEKCYYEW
jgi:hypothetical protein